MNVVSAWWPSKKFPDAYVTAIRSQVPGITVLTPGDGLYEPLRFKGWHCKLEAFRPENAHLRPFLFVDLDTLVYGLSEILALDPTKLWLIHEFMTTRRLGESGLFICPDYALADTIWNRVNAMDTLPRTDGEILRSFPHEYIDDRVKGIYSYKAHGLEKGRPADAAVVCFHGKPWIHEIEAGWAREYWRGHAGL